MTIKSKAIIYFSFKTGIILPLVFLFTEIVNGQGFDYKGQISAWGKEVKNLNEWNSNVGIRYIPQFNYTYLDDNGAQFNSEVLFNIYYENDFHSHDQKVKPYRMILRYSTEQSETQLGLQKINFGPAQLLRSLMWFDRTDPRDPLKLTDGVYALRYRYSFLDNSILWFWCLIGNTDKVGYEVQPTLENTPEFGGRFQLPLLSGEMAATFHSRKVDATFYYYRENRYAIDGRWDLGIGLWFESVLQQNFSSLTTYKLTRMTTLGLDYTIPEGNGIYILGEHLITSFSNSFWETDQSRNISAAMISYPLGVLDNISLQEYYDWHNKNLYQYLQFQRTYDNFAINFALFHYPESAQNILLDSKTSMFSGYGFQLMIIYNY